MTISGHDIKTFFNDVISILRLKACMPMILVSIMEYDITKLVIFSLPGQIPGEQLS